MAEIEIRRADGAEDMEVVRDLFTRYATWLESDHGISLAFQGFEDELAALPGKYAPPRGALFLAFGTGQAPMGCIGLRPFEGAVCEVKRLFVLPEARGTGLGRRLGALVVEEARAIGYAQMVLDTGAFMGPAQRVYEALGFTDIPPYYHNPYPGARFMGMDL